MLNFSFNVNFSFNEIILITTEKNIYYKLNTNLTFIKTNEFKDTAKN